MIRILLAPLACAALLAACSPTGGSGSDDGTGGFGGQPSNADGLRIEPSNLTLMQGQAVELKVLDGKTNVTADATIEVDGESMELVDGVLGASAPGLATVRASVGDRSVTAKGAVNAPSTITVLVPEDAEWKTGSQVQLSAVGKRGSEEHELTWKVVYASSDDSVATVDENGLVTVLGGGAVSFTAQVGEKVSTAVEASIGCEYPGGRQTLGLDNTMPPLTWPAYWPDGEKFQLSLADVQCNAEWKNVKTMTFVVSAGWCGACTAYAQWLQGEVAELEKRGMQVVIVEVQDYEGRPADAAFAYAHLGKITSVRPAIAIGDSDVKPSANFFGGSGYISYFPTTFVVRTSDMRIIADQKVANTSLPLRSIAEDPDADWSGGAPFVNNCTFSDEEAGEPNNTAADAVPITTGRYPGGICEKSATDIYKVQVAGNWTASLDYDPSVGNLAIWVWDAQIDNIAQIGGRVIGSSTGTGRESFTHSGTALVAVQGVQASSAPYVLRITAN